MSVYGTYLHVIGVIIKMRPAFVLNLGPQRAERRDFNNGVSVTGALKLDRFENSDV